MPLKHAPGAKALENMGSTVISVWFAMDREACWWHSHPENVRIVRVRERRRLANSKIVVRFVEVQAGRMYLRPQPPIGECRYAFG
jgi:hypothetical protein